MHGKRFVLLTLFALCCALFGACGKTYDNIYDAQRAGVRLGEEIIIDDVDVSRMTVEGAIVALENKHDELRNAMKFVITADHDTLIVPGNCLPIRFNNEEMILKALKLKKHYPKNNPPRVFQTTMNIEETEAQAALTELTNAFNISPENASVKYDPTAEGRFLYTEHKAGRSIDTYDAAAKLVECVMNGTFEIDIKTEVVAPEYTIEHAKADTRLISEFSTSFSGKTYSNPNRVFNITKAAGLIDGVKILPGEEFDMNATLGNRNERNGWKEATGIRDAKYVQEYGGGVCQVSTTLYNTVLMADLEVTDRSHHSWPLGYIDVGRDATISTGGPNFKFVNSSGAPIVISSSIDKKKQKVIIRIYGRLPEEYAKITLSSREIETLEDPGDEIILDKKLPYNTIVEERESRGGVISETYKKYWAADGSLIKTELVTRDKYRPVKGLIYVSEDLYGGSVHTDTQPWEEEDLTDYFEGLEE